MNDFARVVGKAATHLEHSGKCFSFTVLYLVFVHIQQHQGESPQDKHVSCVLMDGIMW